MRVVICGGGVIGACLAYYLSLLGAAVTVVERRGVACAASGKAGGFLAMDWCDGTPLESLARRSFALHAELAEQPGAAWGYRRLASAAVIAEASGSSRRPLSTSATTAQVHPGLFTNAMMAAAMDRGGGLRIQPVVGITLAGDRSRAMGVVVEDGEVIPGDAVVIAMGPWSALARRWLPIPAVYGLKGNSILLEAAVAPEALFIEIDGETPELFPRLDGTTYFCGRSSEPPLPEDPEQVRPDPGAPEALRAMARRILPALGDARLVASQACYRPLTRSGLPLLGAVPGVANAYLATGHGVWGILNAPASGEAMAELITAGGARTVDLSPFAPARVPL